jgi:hypothetical protein
MPGSTSQPVEGVVVRSGQEPIVVNLNIASPEPDTAVAYSTFMKFPLASMTIEGADSPSTLVFLAAGV